MGSAKDIINLPENVNLGYKVFVTSKRFSVFDLKDYIKDEIPFKDEALCMQAANTFEVLEKNSIKTHYIGLLDENNNVVRIADLKKPSNKMVFKFVDFHGDKVIFNQNTKKYDYSFFEEHRGKINSYLVLIECVFRNGAPEGSSLFRKTIPKWQANNDTKSIDRFLRRTGLSELPKPGDIFPNTIYDFWTKAEAEDRFVGDEEDYEEAYRISGLTRDKFDEMIKFMRKVTTINAEYLKSVGIDDYDGKIEVIYANGKFMLGDFACTLDEDRWMKNKRQLSKEILRLYMEKKFPEFYKHLNDCKAKAKELGIEDFRTLLEMPIPRIPENILNLVGEVYASTTDVIRKNNMFRDIYGVRDLDGILGDLDKLEKELNVE